VFIKQKWVRIKGPAPVFLTKKAFAFNKRTKSLSWLKHEQTCWIPFHDAICSVAAQEIHGSTGLEYKFSNEDYDKIC